MIQDKNQDIISILLALVAYIITTIWPDFNLVKQWNIIVKIVGLMQYILLKFSLCGCSFISLIIFFWFIRFLCLCI